MYEIRSGTSHTHFQQQLMEDTQKTFASPSKEVREKEKRQNKQTKKKHWQ